MESNYMREKMDPNVNHSWSFGRWVLMVLCALVFNILAAQVPTEGLVGYWPFNGNANDMSGNGNHGILGGQSQQPQLTVDRFGNPNSAYQFGGYYNKNWIRVPHSSSLLLGSQMTVSFWFQQCVFSGMDGYGNYTTTNASFSLISKAGDGIEACPGFWITSGLNALTGELSISSSNKNGYGYIESLVNYSFGTQYNCFDTCEWVHYVCVIDDTIAKAYINGVLYVTSSINPADYTVANTQDLYIGRMGCGYTIWYPFHGKIDDVAFYNRAVTEEEISQLFGHFYDEHALNNQIIIDSLIVQKACDGDNGTAQVFPDSANGPYQYALDYANNFQTSNILQNISPGVHRIYVKSACGLKDTLVDFTCCQPPVILHTPDTVIISGTSADLWASGADVLYWTDSSGNILASGPSLTVSPTNSTLYYVTGQNTGADLSGNIVVNGDFEQGNVGFTSSYNYVYSTSYLLEGCYSIGLNANNYHTGFYSWSDHTTETGNYMIINGAQTPNTNVWTQTVTVEPNTDYAFSTWVCSVGGNPSNQTEQAQLQFSVNGVQLGDIFNAPDAFGIWSRYYEVWNSGNNISATLTILNQNNNAQGNDFGIDDIAFAPLTDCSVMDSIRVLVSGYPDNVDSADCTFLPEGTEWGIGDPIISSETVVTVVTPIVGDIDDDGQQEILFTDNYHYINVFRADGTLKSRFLTTAIYNGTVGIAKVKWQDSSYKCIIVAFGTDKRLYAYNANGIQLWQSTQVFSSYNGEQYPIPTISFADFNHDGWTEVYVGGEIYDAATGTFLCKAVGNKGYAGRTWATQINPYQTIAADLYGDNDLEIAIGNSVYAVDIQSRTDPSLNQVSVLREIPTSSMYMEDHSAIPFTDGNTTLVDINHDGRLDVLVMNVDQANRVVYCYIWDVGTQSIICSKKISNARKFGSPLVGDIDNDGNSEICFIVGTYDDHNTGINDLIYALKYNASNSNGEMDVFWTTPHGDDSGCTGLTLFDFNQDGYAELVYRDIANLRIINGSLHHHQTGLPVTQPYDMASFPCVASTQIEYPVVVDVDSDGEAEIVVGGGNAGSWTNDGHLYIFKSAGIPWAPARKVWNQYMYNVTNVNEDLTIPQYLFNNATVFTDPEGVVQRPFNNFLQQATTIDQYGRPFYAVPDVAMETSAPTMEPSASSQMIGDRLVLTFSYCNLGDNALNAPYPITVFANTYGGDTVCTVTVGESLPVDSCTQGEIRLPFSTLCEFPNLNSLVIAVNCAGNGIAQNDSLQPECDTTNNTVALAFAFQIDTVHLTATACDSYLWYGDTLTQSGEYTHTITCDSVEILHLTVVPLPELLHTPDTVIISGTSADLWASGADVLYWTDSSGNILASGPSLTVSPSTSTMYYITGQNYSEAVGNNLVVNGDFEQGNVGFTSDYTNTPGSGYGWYDITTDAIWPWGQPLYGNGGVGLFLLADGDTVPNSVVWRQTVSVTPNTYYAFSAQVASTGNPNAFALMQFSINGVQLGPIFHSPNVLNVWQPYYEVWYSGNNTSATLTILNQNTTGDGNDFGIDDITFTPLTECSVTDSIRVLVSVYPDNVDSADCVFFPEGTEWSIGEPVVSGMNASMSASVPLVGDIDDDGQQEIVMHTDSKILIFNSNAELKNQFNMCNTRQESQLALAKLLYAQGEYKTIIVAYSSNNYFYAYDASGQLLWQSNQPFSSYNSESYKMPAISFADFNHDGWTEMFAGSEVYDAATGMFLCKTNGNKGHAGRTWESYGTYQSSAADLLGDVSLELAVGNTVYAVDIQSRSDASLNQITPLKTIASANMVMEEGSAIPFTDGNTFLVDINLDGRLDVLVMNEEQNGRVIYLYVWDVVSQSILCSKRIPNARKFGMPQIGDIDSDGFPEICFVVGTYPNHQHGNNETIFALKYNEQIPTGEMEVFWTTPHSDYSGATSLTLFDFNQDGYSELVYRDENHLRIINGSMVHHQTGEAVTGPYDLASYACGSGTALEYPIVCDVDQDGAAEIIIASSCNSSSHVGHLYIFKSSGEPWAPARKVWNQYMYNVTNVNEDLTIPQYLFNNATVFTDPEGVVRRPFNNFLQQATTIDQYGRPFYAVPDVAMEPSASSQMVSDSLVLQFSYCNLGDNTLNAPYPITVFANTYGGDTVCTVTVGESLPVDGCTQGEIQLPISVLCGFPNLNSLVIAVNCAGNGIAQNDSLQPECDTTNNTVALAFAFQIDTVHLTATACDSYLWYGDTLTQSGEYTHTITCDSVEILHLTVVPLPELLHTPDTVIISGTSADLWASGADVLYWTDGSGNILASGPSLTVSPVTPTMYYITGQNYSEADGNNLVVNGDFEQGNVGFTSEYAYSNYAYEGAYYIGYNGQSHYPSFATWPDHTSGSGLYMIVNGAGTPNSNAWTQTVAVEPNTDYAFSAWICNLSPSPVATGNLQSVSQLQFSVNGTQLGEIFYVPETAGWTSVYEVWNSGNNTTATITVLNQNSEWAGNDFGLDDISFTPLTTCFTTDSIRVNVTNFPDNVDSADCTFLPEGTEWGVQIGWSSSSIVHNRAIPLVGDLDNDGHPEVVCFAESGLTHYTLDLSRNNTILVYDGVSKALKNTITMSSPVTTYDAAAYGLVKLPSGKGLIVAACYDFKLRAYDITASDPNVPYWESDVDYGSEVGDWAVNLGFADFNHDGHPEVYLRNKVYNAETGVLLAATPSGGNSGSSYCHWTHDTHWKLSSPLAADVYGDANLDLILGNEIYEISIANTQGSTGNSLSLVKQITPPGNATLDGNVQVADFNADGHSDIFISVRNTDVHSGTVYGYVWDVYNDTVSTPFIISTSRTGKSIPMIADIDNDDSLEVLIQCGVSGTASRFRTYKYNYTTMSFSLMWSFATDEDSYSNSITSFDFNQDGLLELLICDQSTVRIVNGSGKSHLTQNDTIPVYVMHSFPFTETTIMQYPVIADVDADGNAEIVSVGSHMLNIMESSGEPWAPARPVWNQYMYNVTNVNKDLTIPQYQFNNATVFTDPEGVVRRPFNNFLQQATTIDQYGRPFYAVPDVAMGSSVSSQTVGDTLTLTFSYCNTGDNILNAPYPITVFANTYGGDTVCTVTVGESLPVDSCTQGEIRLPVSTLCEFPNLNSLVIAVNCAGNGIAQNDSLQPECDTTNNTVAVAFALQVDTAHLTATTCDSYLWYGETLTQSGEYAHTITCDSVEILHLTVVPLPELLHTPDTVIISGTSADLWASGADVLYWTDGSGNILASGPSLTVSPATSTMYYITGQNLGADMNENLVVNGDFEQGNVGFYTEYNYVTGSESMFFGSYSVTTDGLLVWGEDHLYGFGGTGQFMVVDGSESPNAVVWQQTVPVTPNTYYAFSAQVASTLASNAADSYAFLQFSVNGTQLGPIFHSPDVLNIWQPYYEVWYSGSNTSATLTILNQNTNGAGNDFGLDDISFTPLTTCFTTDSIRVYVTDFPDNVDSADCVFFPEGTEWGIGEPLISSAAAITVSTPMVGDIDDDGQQEIVFPAGNSSVVSTINIFNADATLKSQINTVGFYIWNSVGLAKVKWQENEFKSIIVVLGTNKRLYAYDAQGTQLWQSNEIFGCQYNESGPLPAISFADFNHDGWTEIYLGGDIYDAATGVLLSRSSGNKGYSGRTWNTQNNTYQTVAADFYGDSDLELAAGNTVYAVDIQSRTDISANQMTVVREVPSSAMKMEDNSSIPFTDGNTYLADLNLDGRLDVLVMNVDQSNRVVYIYVWDVENQSIICSKKITNARKFGTPQIGDINQDGYDELCFITGTYSAHGTGDNDLIYALQYNSQNTNGELDVLWTKSHSDNSACTGLTLFDFNQDGIAELIYRDRFNLRIINGSMIHHQTGEVLTQPYDMAVYPCCSATGLEYPLVVDVDLDGEAEIVVGGSTVESDYGYLYIFKSAGVPWAPARKVWNQYMYNVTNVNEDLTIPQYQFNNAMMFTDPEGVVRRPFNNFLQQATTIDQYGRPFYAVPDVAMEPAASSQMVSGSLVLQFSYCNLGDNTLNAPYPITVFANTYGGDTVCTVTVGESLPVDSCTQAEIQLSVSTLCGFPNLNSLVIAVNCAGEGIAQNGSLQPECDTTNNTVSLAVALQTDTIHLTATACDSYLWYGETLTQSGEYTHTQANPNGCDSVMTLHLTVVPTPVRMDTLRIMRAWLPYSFPIADTVFAVDIPDSSSFVWWAPAADGCDTMVMQTVLVYPELSITASGTINTDCAGRNCFYNGPSIMINEVMLAPQQYDGSMVGSQYHTSGGGEWIELYNPHKCDSVDISCYFLGNNAWDNTNQSGDWPGGFVIPPGSVVPPQGFAMVRGALAAPVPSELLVQNGGNVVEIVIDSRYCIGGGGGRLWFPNAGGWFAFYDANGVPQDAISWASQTNSCMSCQPCNPGLSDCGYTGELPSYNDISDSRKNYISSYNANNYLGLSFRRIPDGGEWQSAPAAPTYGLCNAECVEPAENTGNAIAVAGVTGGVPPYTYQWNDPAAQTTDTAFSLTAGLYTVTVTDLLGNTITATVPIENFVPEVSHDNASFCYSDTMAVLQGLPVGGMYSGATMSGDTLFFEAGVSFYQMTYTIADSNGCTATDTFQVMVAQNEFEVSDTACSNELPLLWNGLALENAGDYTVELPNVNGCDSVVTIHLTVNQATDSTLQNTVLENNMPYVLNDSTYFLPGTYTQMLTNTAGCDSVLTLVLTVLYNVTDSLDTVVCESALPYAWNDSLYMSAGVYTQTFTAANGADSIVTLNLNILPPTDSTLVVTVVENNLPYQLNGNPYTTSGTYTQHLDNAAGCDSLLTLVLTVLYNVTNAVDTTVCAANLPITWHGHVYTAAGTHTNVLTASNGVDSTVTYTLYVDELSASVGNVTHVVCYGAATGAATVAVTGGQSPLSYQWTTAAGTGISTTTSVSGCVAGNYTFTVTDQLGCTVTVPVTVNTLNDSMQPGTIASDQEVCSGNEIEAFTGTSAAGGDNSAYQWQISTNNTDWTPAPGNNIGQNYSYPNLSSESFWLRRAWISQSCGTVYSNTVMLTVLPVTHDTITVDVCQNNDYQGYGFEVPASEIEQPGEYVFERIQTTGPCDTFFVLLLTVYPEYSTDISDEICEGDGYFANGFNIPAPATIDVEFLSQTLNLQSVHGCDSTVHLALSVTDTAIRIIPLTTDFCETMSAELMVETPMADYVWSTGEQAPTITVTQPGIYSVTATQGVCQATAHIRVENCQYELYLPNAITPSKGDGLNDYFSIPAYNQLGMDKFEISIFNRWGEQVFYSTDKNFRWNGEYRGQIHQEAIYNYIIHYTDLTGKPHKVTGRITVL